jgi:hypothetical protein
MPLGKAGTIEIRAHHSKILRVPSAVVQKTPPRPGVSAGDFPANADWLKVVHGSKAKFRLVRGVACRAARSEELADRANEFLEESSDHFGGHLKTADRTFTGGADFLPEIFSQVIKPYFDQSSQAMPSIREKSRALSVATVQRCTTAVAAISKSISATI